MVQYLSPRFRQVIILGRIIVSKSIPLWIFREGFFVFSGKNPKSSTKINPQSIWILNGTNHISTIALIIFPIEQRYA